MMGEKSFDLPRDVWYRIFKKLDEQDMEQVSLVCKEFLSITNPLKTSLNILDETLPILMRILRRFQHLESITVSAKSLRFCIDYLSLIPRSGLDFDGRKNLKRLKFVNWQCLGDKDFKAIVDLLPWLEEIIFPSSTFLAPKERCEFQNLYLKLRALKKVTFKWDSSLPWDEFLTHLSSTCPNLEEIDMEMCHNHISEETISFMLRRSPKLTTLKLPKLRDSQPTTSLSIWNSLVYAKNLHTVCFYSCNLSKEFVQSLEKTNPRKLQIKFYEFESDEDIKNNYLLELFGVCSSIQHLVLIGGNFLLDNSVVRISQHLTKLTSIDLTRCENLTNMSFFTLTEKCPFLEEITMDYTSIKVGDISLAGLRKHEKLRYLSLSHNWNLDDKMLGDILWVCPNLRVLKVAYCSNLTEEGVRGILKACVSLTHLDIYHIENVSDIFGKYFEGRTVNLQFLEAGNTRLNDKSLVKIGKVCNGLEFLSIRYCTNITNNGVMEVARNCKKLKKINLYGCRNLSIYMLGEMMQSRHSIKRILLPNGFGPSEEQRKLFWKIGCKICDKWDDAF